MIRFRLIDDERRYLILRTELYLRLSQSGADVSVLSDVLRNLGKIESFVYAEGIRQGAVAATVCDEELAALDLHHEVYGRADTPLRAVEKARWGQDETSGVFEEVPMEFAPLTLTEAKRLYAGKPTTAAELQTPVRNLPITEPPPPEAEGDEELLASIEGHRPESDRDANEHLYEVSSPDFLDRVRDELSAVQSSGMKFSDWSDLIYHLHMVLGIDAGALDLQLSTHEGRAVLDQAGFFDFPPPGESFDMARFLDAPPQTPP